MPKFRYTGTETARYGSGLIKPGDVVDLPSAPNKHYMPVTLPLKQAPVTAKKPADSKTDK